MTARRSRSLMIVLALALVASAGLVRRSDAQPGFPHIPVWGYAGAWQDSTLAFPTRCPGAFTGPLADSVREQGRTITIRFKRDPLAELRPDFGGYRVYRVVQTPDTARMVLLRRYSLNPGDSLFSWHLTDVDRDPQSLTYGRFRCKFIASGQPVWRAGADSVNSVVTFVDPDSSGSYQKVCRRVDHLDRCLSPGDSVFRLVIPPGPHDGFLTWYTVTYEARNQSDNNYEDLFEPDTSDWSKCGTQGDPATCPNLNNKRLNMFPDPSTAATLEPTRGQLQNVLRVAVVPNPYRASEAWDPAGGHEIHFINLPRTAKIQIYTVAGDLVRVLQHDDPTRDFERWDLKNANGSDVASGIYMFRVDATVNGQPLDLQHRFVVIR